MDRRADVVMKARECQLGGAGPPANLGLPFDDPDRPSLAGELDRGREAIRSCSNDDRIE